MWDAIEESFFVFYSCADAPQLPAELNELRELSFFTGRGGVCGGDQNFLGWSKGGQFFSVGEPDFFYIFNGEDQKKFVTGCHKQPPPSR